MVGISPYVVCDEQKWLVYQPVLSVMDSNDLYISLFFLSWTKWVGISTGLVCCGQYWLLYQPVLSVMDQYWSVYPPVLSVVNNIGCYISMVCVP